MVGNLAATTLCGDDNSSLRAAGRARQNESLRVSKFDMFEFFEFDARSLVHTKGPKLSNSSSFQTFKPTCELQTFKLSNSQTLVVFSRRCFVIVSFGSTRRDPICFIQCPTWANPWPQDREDKGTGCWRDCSYFNESAASVEDFWCFEIECILPVPSLRSGGAVVECLGPPLPIPNAAL